MNAISVRNVSKKFKIHHDKPSTLKEKVLRLKKNSWEEFWALKDIDIDIKKGITAGLIGQNGSGKSTLLKLMTKIIYPTSGEITIDGRVSSLLELGAGFHPDFTGRENIYTNAAIFGLSKSEIDRRVDDIISFSELGEFIDNPVRTYSSGMYMRLAFAVAINVDPDILLIDEILAVGDANFQKKCMDKMLDFKKKGVTIVIVTHDMGSVQRLCDDVVWLDKGKVIMRGNAHDITASYLEYMGERQGAAVSKVVEDKNEIESPKDEQNNEANRWGNKDIIVSKVEMVDKAGNVKSNFKCGEEVTVRIYYERNNKNTKKPVFGIGVFRNDGVHCYGTNTFIDRVEDLDIKDKGIMECFIKQLLLIRGQYSLDIAIHSEDGFPYDYIRGICSFDLHSNISDVGISRLEHEWKLK